MQLKHYSFDLWLTLIKSNPLFKRKRAEFFYLNYNYSKKSLEEIESIFKNIDSMCNLINQSTGKNIDSDEMYLMVLYQMNESLEQLEDFDSDNLYSRIEELIFQFHPLLFSSDTIKHLETIFNTQDTTLSILSNTAFIKGKTLRKVLDHLNLSNFFAFQIYSDEVGLSKPNKKIFELLLQSVKDLRKGEEIKLVEIVHIGDNPCADIAGAERVGIQAVQINSNNLLINSLLNAN